MEQRAGNAAVRPGTPAAVKAVQGVQHIRVQRFPAQVRPAGAALRQAGEIIAQQRRAADGHPNAKLAGVEKHCRFFTADVKDFSPAPGAMVFTNPPYGERLGDLAAAAELERMLGRRLEENPVRSAYIITADADFEQHFGKKAKRRRKLYNGMIPCQVYMYF